MIQAVIIYALIFQIEATENPYFFMQSIFKPCNSFRYSNTIKLELI